MKLVDRIEKRVALPEDSETRRSQKTLSVIVLLVGALFTTLNTYFIWSAGFSTAAVLSIALIFLTLGMAALILIVPNHWLQLMGLTLILVLLITVSQHLAVGGFASGLAFSIWIVQVPIAAAVIIGLRFTIFTFVLYLIAVIAAVLLEPLANSLAPTVEISTRQQMAGGNMILFGILATAALLYLVRQVDYFRHRSEQLLLNMLPAPIAARLKVQRGTIADSYDAVTVLFADMVGSTPLFSELAPEEAVDWLNEVFTNFDRLVRKHGLEKICTIGDNYMVASGVPLPREDHAAAMAGFALEMNKAIGQIRPRNGKQMRFRIGMHSGPLVAGVIGQEKYQYDLWGDTVNIASRMESHGQVGKVHLSQATYELIKDEYECASRGSISIKGRGEMATWFLIGKLD